MLEMWMRRLLKCKNGFEHSKHRIFLIEIIQNILSQSYAIWKEHGLSMMILWMNHLIVIVIILMQKHGNNCMIKYDGWLIREEKILQKIWHIYQAVSEIW